MEGPIISKVLPAPRQIFAVVLFRSDRAERGRDDDEATSVKSTIFSEIETRKQLLLHLSTLLYNSIMYCKLLVRQKDNRDWDEDVPVGI
jgi:hypothetical protein